MATLVFQSLPNAKCDNCMIMLADKEEANNWVAMNKDWYPTASFYFKETNEPVETLWS